MIENFRHQLQAGLPSNPDETTLRRLVRQIREDRVQIKLFTRYPLHAKLYMVHLEKQMYPRVGYLGQLEPDPGGSRRKRRA